MRESLELPGPRPKPHPVNRLPRLGAGQSLSGLVLSDRGLRGDLPIRRWETVWDDDRLFYERFPQPAAHRFFPRQDLDNLASDR